MSEFRTVIKKAIKQAGGVRALAKDLNCAPSTVSNWNAGGEPKGPLLDALMAYVEKARYQKPKASMLAEDSSPYLLDDKSSTARLLEENKKLRDALEKIKRYADEALIVVQI